MRISGLMPAPLVNCTRCTVERGRQVRYDVAYRRVGVDEKLKPFRPRDLVHIHQHPPPRRLLEVGFVARVEPAVRVLQVDASLRPPPDDEAIGLMLDPEQQL